MFRTDSGEPRVLDDFCPHLGHGGRVQGEHIACPFHGWQFDGDGVCREVPYAKNMPPRVKGKQAIDSYPVIERNAMVWAWYHPRNAAPTFDVEKIPGIEIQVIDGVKSFIVYWRDIDECLLPRILVMSSPGRPRAREYFSVAPRYSLGEKHSPTRGLVTCQFPGIWKSELKQFRKT